MTDYYPTPPAPPPGPDPARGWQATAATALAVALVAVVIALAASARPAGDPTPTPAPTTTVAPVSTTVDPTTTAPTRPTVTDPPAASPRAVLVALMCDEHPGRDGFGVRWCDAEPDDPKVVDLVASACDLLDTIDPGGRLPESAVQDKVVSLLSGDVASGGSTHDQATSMAGLLGAVYADRAALC